MEQNGKSYNPNTLFGEGPEDEIEIAIDQFFVEEHGSDQSIIKALLPSYGKLKRDLNQTIKKFE